MSQECVAERGKVTPACLLAMMLARKKSVALSIFDSLCVKTYRFIQASGQSKVQPGGPIAAPGHIINVQQPLL